MLSQSTSCSRIHQMITVAILGAGAGTPFFRAKTQDTHLRPMASCVGRHHEANAPPICPWVLVQTANYRRITDKHKHHFFHVHVFEQDILFGRVETQQFCMPHSFIVSFKSHTLSAVVRHAKPIALEQ